EPSDANHWLAGHALHKRGILDFIGAARPSIADPFLPKKIEDGELERIRECIGCNICVSGDMTISPIRCTQNPAMGEEWRRGWHPERAPMATHPRSVLVIGGGPAGLEAARVCSLRGHQVTLAESQRELGGRLLLESKLPGLASWIRVRDYRTEELKRADNVELFLESELDVEHIFELAPATVVLATGARWRSDGVGRAHHRPIPGFERALTPDNVMAGQIPAGRVVIFDDDHYIMGGALAEALVRGGHQVSLVTPAHSVSAWTTNTLEHGPIQKRMRELGVQLLCATDAVEWRIDGLVTRDVYDDRRGFIEADSLISVTARLPNECLLTAMEAARSKLQEAGVEHFEAIGDAHCPATVAAAVWSGYRFAFELDLPEHEREMKRQVHGELYPA
ncbi:MAG: FAD-dependent oxidoreductase, partial [Myxococcota bacterium]